MQLEVAGSLCEKQSEEAMQGNGPRVRRSKGERIVSMRALTPSAPPGASPVLYRWRCRCTSHQYPCHAHPVATLVPCLALGFPELGPETLDGDSGAFSLWTQAVSLL